MTQWNAIQNGEPVDFEHRRRLERLERRKARLFAEEVEIGDEERSGALELTGLELVGGLKIHRYGWEAPEGSSP